MKSVLVVENHHDLRTAIVAALTREHFACDAVLTGDAALLRLKDHRYEYIFVDDEAIGVAALIDDLATRSDSPKLVLLTEADRGDDAGFLRKPFDSKQLLARLNA